MTGEPDGESTIREKTPVLTSDGYENLLSRYRMVVAVLGALVIGLVVTVVTLNAQLTRAEIAVGFLTRRAVLGREKPPPKPQTMAVAAQVLAAPDEVGDPKAADAGGLAAPTVEPTVPKMAEDLVAP